MKRIVICAFLLIQVFSFAQSKPKDKGAKCELPTYKKGQTSAQINEETRIYVECVKEYKERQAIERRKAAEEAEARKAEKNAQQAAERERNRLNAQINKEKRQEETRRRDQERRDASERDRLKRDLQRENQPEVGG